MADVVIRTDTLTRDFQSTRAVDALTLAGKTALDLAADRDEAEMVEILRARAGDPC